jgi:hypothetical protein
MYSEMHLLQYARLDNVHGYTSSPTLPKNDASPSYSTAREEQTYLEWGIVGCSLSYLLDNSRAPMLHIVLPMWCAHEGEKLGTGATTGSIARQMVVK